MWDDIIIRHYNVARIRRQGVACAFVAELLPGWGGDQESGWNGPGWAGSELSLSRLALATWQLSPGWCDADERTHYGHPPGAEAGLQPLRHPSAHSYHWLIRWTVPCRLHGAEFSSLRAIIRTEAKLRNHGEPTTA